MTLVMRTFRLPYALCSMTRPSQPLSDRELVSRIARSAGGKAGYKQLVRELGLGGGMERRVLLEQLARLVNRGELRHMEGELWGMPSKPERTDRGAIKDESTQSVSAAQPKGRQATLLPQVSNKFAAGRLELHRDGYGFVRPESPRGQIAPGRPVEDIFIPPNALHGAMHGDVVLVDEDAAGRDGRRSGRIARVLTRRNTSVVGVFHYAQGWSGRRVGRRGAERGGLEPISGNFVQPWDDRLGEPIEIPPGAERVDPTHQAHHRTLGGEASRLPEGRWEHARDLDTGGRLEGLAVEVEITMFPQPGRPAQGRVIEVLGPPDAFGVDVEIIIRKHGIPHTFPAHVLAEADERAKEDVASLPSADLAEREDFRGLPIVTIDGETAKDFDDAVLVRTLPNGNSELQVHIADVSHYVLPGSALDTEARVRGTSVYFPDRAVPMLPHALSSGMCSLLPNEDRLALSCVMEIDDRGEVLGYRVAEGVIRSVRRMTYTSVQRCFNASPAVAGWNQHAVVTAEPTAEDEAERERVGLEQPELPAAFDRMLELALRLNRKRVRRGSIDFDLPEPIVQFDPDGNMKAIVRSERGWAHRLIEEFMLSANEVRGYVAYGAGDPIDVPDP